MSHAIQNRPFLRRSSQPISWLSTEKPNQTKQKQTCICNKIYYNTKRTQKTKARFGHHLQPLVWKWNGPSLKEVHKEVNGEKVSN